MFASYISRVVGTLYNSLEVFMQSNKSIRDSNELGFGNMVLVFRIRVGLGCMCSTRLLEILEQNTSQPNQLERT